MNWKNTIIKQKKNLLNIKSIPTHKLKTSSQKFRLEMMKTFSLLILLLVCQSTYAQVLLDADGPGDTYQLITSVLAPGHNPIETPDCNHQAFGDHIDEVFDDALNANVFRFHIHTSPDNDRCINLDRQRNEIKSYDKSPDNLLGVVGEKVVYKWKFKLSEGFQSSPNFTHLHQLKSVGGSLASMPMYTLTTRKGSPDRLELRYAETDSQITLTQTAIAPFIGTWLSVTETIQYGTTGTYEIKIERRSDGEVLLDYTNPSIVNWRAGADFVRPKWGIYRSLDNDQDLRDEAVLFANFSVEEVETVSSENPVINDVATIFSNPVDHILSIKNIDPKINLLQVFSLDGRQMMEQSIATKTEIQLGVASFPQGTYILNLKGEGLNQSKLFLVF